MRRNGRRRVVIAMVLLALVLELCAPPTLPAQSSSRNENGPSLAQIAEELRAQFGPVRFHREEQLEDQFVVRAWAASTVPRAPRIFHVEAQRFDISENSVTERTPNGVPTMYVATSSDGSKIYKLGGFSAAEQEFSRLVSEGPSQKIRSQGDAESRGLLCAEIVYGLPHAWWLEGAANAKLKAAEHFFAEGHEDGLRLGEKWWNSFKGDQAALKITTTKMNAAFSVNLPVFWAPVEGHSVPEIRVYHIDVSEGGTCHMGEPMIYR